MFSLCPTLEIANPPNALQKLGTHTVHVRFPQRHKSQGAPGGLFREVGLVVPSKGCDELLDAMLAPSFLTAVSWVPVSVLMRSDHLIG